MRHSIVGGQKPTEVSLDQVSVVCIWKCMTQDVGILGHLLHRMHAICSRYILPVHMMYLQQLGAKDDEKSRQSSNGHS